MAHSYSDFRDRGAVAGPAPLGFGSALLIVGWLAAFCWPALADGGTGGDGGSGQPGGAGGTGFIGNPGADSGSFSRLAWAAGAAGAPAGAPAALAFPQEGVPAAPVVAREVPTVRLEEIPSPPSSLAGVAVAAGASTATAQAPPPLAIRLR